MVGPRPPRWQDPARHSGKTVGAKCRSLPPVFPSRRRRVAPHMPSALIQNFRSRPDRGRSLSSYREAARGYDATCGRIEAIRRRAIDELAPAPGERLIDVACGTGATLPTLARAVGADGRVIGIEQSPEMAAQARGRAAHAEGGATVEVRVCAVEDTPLDGPRADGLLLCWTHDVLQSPAALDRLLALARPGARLAIAGMITLPWWWGAPVNLVNLYRARRYMTTWAGLDRPWRGLEERGARIRVVHRALWGTAYVAVGRMPGPDAPAPRAAGR
jgi:ubiquinone/menaquinone biosynthesis C-methylase UbiE